MSRKFKDCHPYKKSRLLSLQKEEQTHRDSCREAHVQMETEIVVMFSETKECLVIPEAERVK